MIDVEIEARAWSEALPDAEALVRQAAAAALAHELRDDATLAVLLTDDHVREWTDAQVEALIGSASYRSVRCRAAHRQPASRAGT